MLIELLSQSNYISVNIKLAKIFGVEGAIYISEILNIYDKAVRKNKEWRECKNIKYFNIDDLGQILCEIANKGNNNEKYNWCGDW